MSEVKSILLSGVGGQGTILVTRILTEGLLAQGYDVKMSEIHGMAQRGGSVSTQVRYGREVNSPIIGLGGADILVGFEKMEAVRNSEYLKPDGVAIINNYEIVPLTVATGQAEYPEGLLEAMEEKFTVHAFNAMEVAEQVGNIRTMNVVLFGAMVAAFPALHDIDWETVIAETVPEKFIEVNLQAFRAGRRMVEEK